MKVSIVLNVLNIDKNLVECIESIRTQNLCEYELFICLFDSFDRNCIELVKNYMIGINYVTFIQGTNINNMKNDAIKLSKGEYIIFIDSNEKFKSNILENIYKEAFSNDLDILTFDHTLSVEKRIFDEKRVELSQKEKDIKRNRFLDNSNITTGINFCKTIVEKNLDFLDLSNYLYRNEFLKENNIFLKEFLYNNSESFILESIIKSSSIKYISEMVISRKIISKNKIIIEESVDSIIKNIDSIIKLNLKHNDCGKIILNYVDKLIVKFYEYKNDLYLVKIKGYLKNIICDIEDYLDEETKINFDIMINCLNLNLKKIAFDSEINKNKHNCIVNLTRLSCNIKQDTLYNFSKQINELNKFKIFNKYKSYDDMIKYITEKNIDMLKQSLYELIDDLQFEIYPEMSEYNYMKQKFRDIFNNKLS